MQDIVAAAENVERLGIVGILAGICIVEALIIFKQWKEWKECHRQLLRAVQGKEVE